MIRKNREKGIKIGSCGVGIPISFRINALIIKFALDKLVLHCRIARRWYFFIRKFAREIYAKVGQWSSFLGIAYQPIFSGS